MLFAVVLLILLIVLLFLLWRQLRSTPVSEPLTRTGGGGESVESIPARGSTEEETFPLFVDAEEEAARVSLESTAKIFAERYGSYSRESEFANVRDVLSLMSASFAAQAEAAMDREASSDGYYGVTTRILNLTVTAMDEEKGMAEVRVNTQRAEARESAQHSTVSYQTLALAFVKEHGVWKVDGVTWE
jgi:hypothetical protein